MPCKSPCENQYPCENTCNKCHKKRRVPYWLIGGGGTSGSVLASILSNNKSVVVLEAGKNRDNDPEIRKPDQPPQWGNSLSASLAILYDWQQVSIGQIAVNNLTFPYQNGRLLGGSSSHNGTQYVRPTNYFLNNILFPSSGNDPMWSAANVNNNFTQLENYHGDINPGDVRGTNGPFKVRQAPRPDDATPANPSAGSIDIMNKMVLATSNMTNKTTLYNPANPAFGDYNDTNIPLGVTATWQLEQSWLTPEHTRQATSIVFLDPIIDPVTGKGLNGRKLQIITEAHVDKVIFNKKTAIGLKYIAKDGKCREIYTKGEVILSAGAFSCEILMRSGYGNYSNPNAYTSIYQAPTTLLSSLGIKKVYDNPNVGQNTDNHPLSNLVVLNTPVSGPNSGPILPLNDQDAAYVTPAFLADTRPTAPPSTVRAIEFIASHSGTNPVIGSSAQYPPATGAGANSVRFLNLETFPKSRGSVVLQSANPTIQSIEDAGLLRDKQGPVASFTGTITNPSIDGVFGSVIQFSYSSANPPATFQPGQDILTINGVSQPPGIFATIDMGNNTYVLNQVVPSTSGAVPMTSTSSDDLDQLARWIYAGGNPANFTDPLNGPGYNLVGLLTTESPPWTFTPGSPLTSLTQWQTYVSAVNFVKANFNRAFHYVASCAMGKVVDSKCRVIGVKNLRVIDNSILVQTVDGNTGAMAVLIGFLMGNYLNTL